MSDLSAKILKTESVEIKEDALFIQDTFAKVHEAVLEILSLLNTRFVSSEGIPHAGTILSAAAWLTGISLYQSFQERKRSWPGTVVLPQDVNREWENLVYTLEKYNLQRADIPVGRVVLAAMAAPVSFKPRVQMQFVRRELQEQYHTVMKAYGFETLEGAHVGILLCSMLIQQYSQAGMIDVEAATGVVAQGIFEAARQGLDR